MIYFIEHSIHVCVCVQKNILNNAVPNLQLKVETTNKTLAYGETEIVRE